VKIAAGACIMYMSYDTCIHYILYLQYLSVFLVWKPQWNKKVVANCTTLMPSSSRSLCVTIGGMDMWVWSNVLTFLGDPGLISISVLM